MARSNWSEEDMGYFLGVIKEENITNNHMATIRDSKSHVIADSYKELEEEEL